MTIWARAMIGRLRLHSSILQARKRVRRPTEPCAPAAGVLQKVGAMLQPSVGHGQLARPPRPSASRTRSARTQRRKASVEHWDVIGGITARIWDASVRVSTPRSLNGEQRRPGPNRQASSIGACSRQARANDPRSPGGEPSEEWNLCCGCPGPASRSAAALVYCRNHLPCTCLGRLGFRRGLKG